MNELFLRYGSGNVKGKARAWRDESSQRDPWWSGTRPSKLQVAPKKGNGDKKSAQLVNGLHEPLTRPP